MSDIRALSFAMRGVGLFSFIVINEGKKRQNKEDLHSVEKNA